MKVLVLKRAKFERRKIAFTSPRGKARFVFYEKTSLLMFTASYFVKLPNFLISRLLSCLERIGNGFISNLQRFCTDYSSGDVSHHRLGGFWVPCPKIVTQVGCHAYFRIFLEALRPNSNIP